MLLGSTSAGGKEGGRIVQREVRLQDNHSQASTDPIVNCEGEMALQSWDGELGLYIP